MTSQQTKKPSGDESLFYQILSDELKARLGNAPAPYPIFIRNKSNSTLFQDAFDQVDGWLHLVFNNGLKKQERTAMYRLAVKLICQHVQDFVDAPLAVKVFCNCCKNIGAIMDRNFPGYAAMGAMSFVLKQQAGGVRHLHP